MEYDMIKVWFITEFINQEKNELFDLPLISETLLVSHLDKSPLKDSASLNMSIMNRIRHHQSMHEILQHNCIRLFTTFWLTPHTRNFTGVPFGNNTIKDLSTIEQT